jgi:ferredoxin-NADP reductase/DMSO/TMAO reductase YedYZ heme-binding membrane subunit
MKDVRFAKFVLLVNALVPGVLLLWDANRQALGANPVNFAILTTGMLALVFIGLTLLVTPLRAIPGLSWIFPFRKSLGLFAFFYAMAHFAIFFALDRELNIASTLSEMVKRPYLIVGSIALLLMVPLAITSFDVAIKWMGARRWKWLHRLFYVTAILATIHYFMQVKADIRMPLIFMGIFVLLLMYRVIAWIIPIRKQPLATDGKWSGLLRVEKITQETPTVRTFRLISPTGGPLPFHYQPGQYLTFSLPIDGRTVKRSYTIASSPTRPEACEVTIKREQPGTSSRYMHESVQVGDVLQLTAPSGQFTFGGGAEQGVVLLGGGVGITPLMSILRALTDRAWPGQIHLLYSNKSEEEIIFRREIEALQQRHANLHVTFTLTRASGDNWGGRIGRIDAALLQELVPDLRALPIFICGPDAMLKTLRELLPTLGVPDSHIHTESFGTASAADNAEVQTFQVRFSTTGTTAPAPSDLPLLDIAESIGIEIDNECRSGVCGRCKCQLLSGTVVMATQDALDPAEKAKGIILMCQARAMSDVTVNA